MKSLLSLVAGLLFFVTASASAVELRDASNQQILDELSFRLGAGGGSGSDASTVRFACDIYGDLIIGLVNASGYETKKDVVIRNQPRCNDQASKLNLKPAAVTSVRLVGICDIYGDLNRFSLTTNGTINQLDSYTVRNYDNCLVQAAAMNK
jgi:hypothetical protein